MKKRNTYTKKKACVKAARQLPQSLTDHDPEHVSIKSPAGMAHSDLERLVQERTEELRIHQIELETQNEELRNAQLLLEGSRRKYADLYDFAPIGYFSFNGQGLILDVNFTGARLLGYEKKNLHNKPFRLFISTGKGKDRFEDHKRTAFSTGTRQTCELQLIRNDGGLLHARLESICNLQPEKASGECILTAITDVTAERQAEETLRQSESEFRAAFESTSVGMSQADPSTGRLLRVNSTLMRILGYAENELIGRPFLELTHPDDRQSNWKEFSRLIKGEIEVYEVEKRFIRKGGAVIHGHVMTSMIRDTTGKPVRTVAVVTDITERKRAEEEARESRERFKAFMNNSQTIAWMKDDQGRYVYISESYEKRFGVRFQDCCGKTDSQLWPPEISEKLMDNDSKVLEGGQAINVFEETLNPETYWWNFKFPYRDSSGRKFVGGIGVDITERRRTEAALKESEERYRNLVNFIPLGMILVRGNRVCWANNAALSLFGAGSQRELLDKSPFDLCPSACHKQIEQYIEDLKRGMPVRTTEQSIVRIDGTELHVEVSLASFVTDQGFSFLAMLNDISSRKQAEAALRENEEQFERLFQSSNDGILMHSLYTEKRKPVFIHANDAVCRMLGYSIEEMQQLTVYDIVKTEETADLTHEREALLRDWVLMHQKTLLCKNGRHVPVEINSSVFEHRGDLMALSIVRDITERRKSEDAINNLNVELRQSIGELAQTNKELEAFIYSVSHDLRAPLMSIGGFSDFLMREYADKLDARGKEHLSRVMKNAVRMNQTIEDLLNLSRISRHEIRKQEVNITSVAESITGDMRQTQPNRAITVEIQPGMTVLGDAGLIRIALSNLLRNAWKFTAKTDNARIELGSLKHEDNVEFYVRDNGAGFDQTFSDKLFLPFHRLHSDQEFEGTGIGLAITERVIRRHGGRIRAEGKRNEGASFYFTLQ